jgi:hypothetical protein
MPVYPGFHQDFELFLYPDTIQPAIRKIAANFYITRGFKRIQIGNTGLKQRVGESRVDLMAYGRTPWS